MLHHICSLLPDNISRVIENLDKKLLKEICEIRLRKEAPLTLTTYTKNLFVGVDGGISSLCGKSYMCSKRDIDYLINRLCEGSVYRYMTTINSGYIVTDRGVRAGVAGECIYENGKISALSSIQTVNLRLPRDFENSGDIVTRFLIKNPTASVLLISPPGYGKTTVIRSVAHALGKGLFSVPKRVAVIDERGEIFPNGAEGLIDRFSGYSKSDGIEIATRLFSPELIVCDEIGHSDDTEALLSVQNSGVPLLATTHGKNVESVFRRPVIKKLIDNSVFDAFAVIEKNAGSSKIVIEERKN